MLINGGAILPEILDCTFIWCEGEEDGGGVYLLYTDGGTNGENIPVSSCRFVGCSAKGISSWTTDNDADGGGLIFWCNEHTFGVHNSLFAKCESKLRAGGSFLTVNKVFFNNIIRFCFYCENNSPNGRNALIHFNGTDGTPWNIVFFHSFSSDSSLINSIAEDYDVPTPLNQNWLP